MLLLIALANAHVWLYDRPVGMRGYPRDLDRRGPRWSPRCSWCSSTGAPTRCSALLFGYGITQLATRRAAAGAAAGRRGAAGPAARLVDGRDRAAARRAAVGGRHRRRLRPARRAPRRGARARRRRAPWPAMAVAGTVLATVVFGGAGAAAAVGHGAAAVDRRHRTRCPRWRCARSSGGRSGWSRRSSACSARSRWGPGRPGTAARRPRGATGRCCVGVAVAGLGTAVVGGLPLALAVAGVWAPSLPALLLCGALHALGGYAGGVGLRGAVRAARVRRVRRRPGPVVRALRGCGSRSLSCYLAQSVAFVALLPGLDARPGRPPDGRAGGAARARRVAGASCWWPWSRRAPATAARRRSCCAASPTAPSTGVRDPHHPLLHRRRHQPAVAREEPARREPA